MKSLTFLGACLFACSVPAFAQLPDTTSSPAQIPDSQSPDRTKPLAQAPDSEKSSQSKTDNHAGRGTASGKKTAMVGCILGRNENGKYVLITEEQLSSVELMSTEDLKPYVGHKVKVKGTINNASPTQTDTRGSLTASASNAGDKKMPESTDSANSMLVVTKVKTISRSCDMHVQ